MREKELTGRAFLAAGSRDGDRLRHMSEALGRLEDSGVAILQVSSMYETEPVGLPGEATLLNGAVEVRADRTPRDLLEACLAVERSLGRRREEGREGLRTIDLDVLLYEDRTVSEPGLTIPHPRMHQRRFVLQPLAEIAAGVKHPLLGRSIESLLEACVDPAWVRLFAPASDWRPRG